ERRDVSSSMKYVELMVVADHAEVKSFNFRYLLKSRGFLGNKITVTNNPYSTLGAFLAWRRKQLPQLPNDNAQLVTSVSLTIIGLAPLKAMCSEYQSGGVNSDHSNSAVGVAATMAHEMGHNFGMSHDSPGCCLAQPEDGEPKKKMLYNFKPKELKRYLSSGGGKCLFNPPNTRCDCGEECSSPCCNANNCTLKIGAECAHGVCCHECKLKTPGVMCRPPSGSCDLPEYCDGKSESCPANFYLVDGSSCTGGSAYCYTGICLTLEQQCLSLWGKGLCLLKSAKSPAILK
uniref:ADAM metallopeptidase domain 19 n=1 Tax=Sinocyclocheilus grahami TaxID=75366 RepID=A0A672NXN9_SINGR